MERRGRLRGVRMARRILHGERQPPEGAELWLIQSQGRDLLLRSQERARQDVRSVRKQYYRQHQRDNGHTKPWQHPCRERDGIDLRRRTAHLYCWNEVGIPVMGTLGSLTFTQITVHSCGLIPLCASRWPMKRA